MVLAVDDYGNPLRSASAGYGRRFPTRALAREDQEAQRKLRLTYTENGYTNPVELPDAHRTPMPSETRMFEIVGLRPPGRRCSASPSYATTWPRSGRVAVQDWNADPASLPAARPAAHRAPRCATGAMTWSGRCRSGVLEPLGLPYRSTGWRSLTACHAVLYGDRVTHRMLSRRLRKGRTRPGGSHPDRTFYSPGD